MIVDQTETFAPAAPEIAAPRPHRMLQRVFSFTTVRIGLLVMMTVLSMRSRFNNPDTWWNLKLGETIWNTHSIPRFDQFSFTTGHHPYIAHEWLSQLTMYAAYHFGGYTGLMLWLCVFACLLSLAAYALCWLYSENAKIAFFGALGVWLFATVGFGIRAELIGYLLLICESLILHLGRSRNTNWFLLLPPLFAVWINCHGSFFFGIALLAVFLCCSFVDFRTGFLISTRWKKSVRNRLLACSALSVAALFVNPIGPKLIWYPLNLMFTQHLNLAFVTEWQPTPFNDVRAWALLGSAALVLLLPLLKRVDLLFEELVLVAIALALAVQHQRMLIVFGVLAMPAICRLLAWAWGHNEPDRDRTLLNAIVLAIASAVIVLGFPSSRDLSEQVNAGNPVKALQFIKHSGLSGRMLNDYDYGGYLIWAAPERKVFIDGRTDIFEWTGVLRDYLRWMTLKDDPRVVLDKYHIEYCLLSRQAPITRVLPLLPGWKSVYADSMSVVFARSPAGATRK